MCKALILITSKAEKSLQRNRWLQCLTLIWLLVSRFKINWKMLVHRGCICYSIIDVLIYYRHLPSNWNLLNINFVLNTGGGAMLNESPSLCLPCQSNRKPFLAQISVVVNEIQWYKQHKSDSNISYFFIRDTYVYNNLRL